jgi:hypothetical protein
LCPSGVTGEHVLLLFLFCDESPTTCTAGRCFEKQLTQSAQNAVQINSQNKKTSTFVLTRKNVHRNEERSKQARG